MQLTNALSFFVWVVDIPTEDWIAPSFQSALQVFSKYWCASLSDQSDKARLPEGLITSQPVTFRLFAYSLTVGMMLSAGILVGAMCLNGNFDNGEPCKFRLDFPESASGMAPSCSSISAWDAEPFLVSNPYTTALAWLCA